MGKFQYVLVIVLLLFSREGLTQNEDPFRIPAQSIPAIAANSCATNQALMDAQNDLRESISNIFTPGNYSCGGTPGWTRVAYLDMMDPEQSCPTGLHFATFDSLRVCRRDPQLYVGGCSSVYYNVSGLQYTKVCGRIRGYQFGITRGFASGTGDIDSFYVDGVSLTHGFSGERTHIWTLASGISELQSPYAADLCPCSISEATQPPSFVGNDYYCESGNSGIVTFRLYTDDPLWDGLQCTLSCCQQEYFTKTLPARTTNAIEIRLCGHSDHMDNHDTPIDQVEIYVQ